MGRPKGSRDKKPLAQRFWEKVEKTSRCWNWTAAKNNKGYGKFWDHTENRLVLAHRFSWRAAGNLLTNADLVLHNCDNRVCVRPDHLRVGTHHDNMTDALSRDRGHGRSKLNPSKVRKIRELIAHGSLSLSEIGARFSITKAAVAHIKYGVTWAWLHN